MLVEWFIKGGVMMYFILLASVVALAVILERFSFYRRLETGRQAFVDELCDCLDVFQTEAAEELCKKHPGPLASVALAAVAASDRPREELKDLIAEAGARELPRIEAGLPVLATVAHVAPLLGLLGTVLGMIGTFQGFQEAAAKGAITGPELMASGIWEALITTVAGLCVGIISQIAHNYLHTRKERLIHDLEEASAEILEILVSKQKR